MTFQLCSAGGIFGADAEGGQHLVVEAGGVIGLRHRVDVVDVPRLDHGAFAHVAEQAELAPLFLGDFTVGAAQKDIRLDADRAQFLHRVLGRLCLEFAGARDERQQRQMNVDGMIARQFVLELTNRFEERQALDVADGAADFHQHEIIFVIAREHEFLDRVGDVRNHLNGRAEIIAAAFLGDDVLIDAPGGDVVGLGGRTPGEALVMAEIEIGLGAVVGHEHFAVLIRRHRSGIEVEIGVEFAETDLVPASLQQGTECRRSQTLSERRNHAAGDEYVPRHGTQPLRPLARFAKTNRMHGRTFCRAVGDVNFKAISEH